jgi:hypothetical protein
MRVVTKPVIEFSDVFDTCVAGVGNANTRTRFGMIKANLIELSLDYENKALAEELYLSNVYGSEGVTVPLISKVELKNLYENQMAKKGRPGREYYDYLRSLAPRGLCPFCGISSARTLDHIMPKAHYPKFSIFPVNLVACCRDCNTEKLDGIATSIQEQKIHPYYDNFTNEQWLFSDVVNQNGPVIVFRVVTSPDWDIKKSSKIASHLTTYDLDERFGDLANSEIAGIKKQMQDLHRDGGADAVKAELTERALSHGDNHINSWQTAMYQALSQSDWYCDDGFR